MQSIYSRFVNLGQQYMRIDRLAVCAEDSRHAIPWTTKTVRNLQRIPLFHDLNLNNGYSLDRVINQECHRYAMMPWTSCQIREIASAHAPGMPGTFSPSPQVSDPDMHHGTCVTHVPWCMPGSLTSGFIWNRRRGKTFPAFPAHAQPAILRIW